MAPLTMLFLYALPHFVTSWCSYLLSSFHHFLIVKGVEDTHKEIKSLLVFTIECMAELKMPYKISAEIAWLSPRC